MNSQALAVLLVVTTCWVPSLQPAARAAAQAATPAGSAESAVPTSTVPLSPGSSDVLALARGRVSEETVVAFVQNAGRNYNLTASEIIYLKGEGVSDKVLAVMLAQRQKANEIAVAAGAPRPEAQAAPSPQYVQARLAPQYVQAPPAPTYVAPPPVYVVENPAPTYVYESYYPRYYGYGYPAVSFSLGFGGYYRGGIGWGGYRGGGGYGGAWGNPYRGGFRGGGGFGGGFAHGGHHR